MLLNLHLIKRMLQYVNNHFYSFFLVFLPKLEGSMSLFRSLGKEDFNAYVKVLISLYFNLIAQRAFIGTKLNLHIIILLPSKYNSIYVLCYTRQSKFPPLQSILIFWPHLPSGLNLKKKSICISQWRFPYWVLNKNHFL